MEPICPHCHVTVRATDYFCFNCGKNLKPKPLSTSLDTLFLYYLGAVVLPPLGIIWGFKYVGQPDVKSKLHGAILIVLTIIECILLTVWTINFVNSVNKQVNQQINGLQGF